MNMFRLTELDMEAYFSSVGSIVQRTRSRMNLLLQLLAWISGIYLAATVLYLAFIAGFYLVTSIVFVLGIPSVAISVLLFLALAIVAFVLNRWWEMRSVTTHVKASSKSAVEP